ncbi:MAG: hypothetical protein WCO85_05450 [Actinomycetes bacterium]|jgi:hypothetical protein
MIIDCDTCTQREIACGDCVVSVLLTITPSPAQVAPEVSEAGQAAISALAAQGLVPPLQYLRQA